MSVRRCPWCEKSELERIYHDEEWGVPCRNDKGLFEFILLESAQAGLSWATILRKRQGYRRAFADFSAEKVAAFTPADVDRLLGDTGIVRNRKKIESAVNNAACFLETAARHGGFHKFYWSFSDGRAIVNAWEDFRQVPASTPLSDSMAREFKRLGFKFLGSTTLYAMMQATGMVNDHLVSCFRHGECKSLA